MSALQVFVLWLYNMVSSVLVSKRKYTTIQGRQTGGGVGGVSTPPEFWMGGLNTCQPPLILKKNF